MSDWRATPPWKAIDPPLRADPTRRNPAEVRAVLLALEVTTAPRYRRNQQGKNETYCNIFVWDATKALGCEVPHVFLGKELNANAVCDWLAGAPGYGAGWQLVDAAVAWAKACVGLPVVAAWKNPGGIGHVAMLCPPASAIARPTGIRIAQAGSLNFFDASLSAGFGALPVRFFAHP